MKLLVILLVATIGSALAETADIEWTEEMVESLMSRSVIDTTLTVPELIATNGYNIEVHSVTTEDGYILEMHRISGSPKSPAAEGKPVIFLMHGLLSSSADWIIMGPENGFAYILADAGYDVWMGNARGNTFSKAHVSYTDLSGKDFWYFSWHEIGYYDLPAMIDYALAATGQEQVIYIGHSQGTTSFYVMASERTEYNDKVKVMVALAPVAYMSNLQSPIIRVAALFYNTLNTVLSMFGQYEFMPSTDTMTSLGATFCDDDALTQFLCTNTLFVVSGFNKEQLNTTMLPSIFAHTPAGASTRQLVHYGQGIRSGKFRWYDFGSILNLVRYRSLSAPTYDLSKVTAPTVLVYGDNDYLAAVEDVMQLYSELGNGIAMVRVPDSKWTHLDFLWGIDAKELVYDRVMTIIENNFL